MIKKRLLALNVIIGVSFGVALLSIVATVVFFLSIILNWNWFDRTVLVVLLLLLYVLTVGSAFTIALSFGRARALKNDSNFLLSHFGRADVNIYSEESFISAMKRVKLNRGEKYIFLGFAVKNIGGSGTLSSVGTSLLYAINELVYSEAMKSVAEFPGIILMIDNHNNYFMGLKTDDVERVIDNFRKIAFLLSNEFEKRDDIPYASFLLSCATAPSKKTITEGLENCRYALWRNATSRVSNDLLVYEVELREEDKRQKELDTELERALKNEELIIYYQAKYSLKTNSYYGAEALLRWKHPKRGLLPPAVFIPYCENSGKIVEIDRYVYEHVCRDIAAWKAEGQRKLIISVNLSRRSVYDPGLLEFLESTIKANGVDPASLDIELTESLAATNLTFIGDIIRRIKKLGCETSIDDFGVGYSSLSSLKNISFDILKIDKSFVDDIEIDRKAVSMITSIIHMAHDFGMSVIAEGVETKAQNDILNSLGLDSIQGYYYSRPSDKAHFDALLADNPFEKEGGAL